MPVIFPVKKDRKQAAVPFAEEQNPCVKVTCGFFMKGLLFPVWYVKIGKKIGKIQA